VLAGAVAGAALLAAACGGGGSSGPAAAGRSTHQLPFTAAQMRTERAKLLKVVVCMRAHGYPAMPDPVIRPDAMSIAPPAGADPRSPQFQAALSTCGLS
jgi:hypothetical protein